MFTSGATVIVSVKRNKELYHEHKAEVLSKVSKGYKVRMLSGPKVGEKREFTTANLRADPALEPEKKKKTAAGLFDNVIRG